MHSLNRPPFVIAKIISSFSSEGRLKTGVPQVLKLFVVSTKLRLGFSGHEGHRTPEPSSTLSFGKSVSHSERITSTFENCFFATSLLTISMAAGYVQCVDYFRTSIINHWSNVTALVTTVTKHRKPSFKSISFTIVGAV